MKRILIFLSVIALFIGGCNFINQKPEVVVEDTIVTIVVDTIAPATVDTLIVE